MQPMASGDGRARTSQQMASTVQVKPGARASRRSWPDRTTVDRVSPRRRGVIAMAQTWRVMTAGERAGDASVVASTVHLAGGLCHLSFIGSGYGRASEWNPELDAPAGPALWPGSARYPADRLLIVFDIDGTIVDPRHVVRARLLEYDRLRDSDHFRGLEADEVNVAGKDVDRLLAERGLPPMVRRDVLDWYLERDGWPEPALGAVRAYPGVLEVIRWFQLQASTFVGLNTDRAEGRRDETLRSLMCWGDSRGSGLRAICFT